MGALKLAFAFGDARVAPAGALSAQTWFGGPMPAGAGASVEGAERRLLLCDLPADAAVGIAAPSGSWAWFGVQILGGGALAPMDAGGLLMNIMSVGAEHEEEFNEWYDREHMPRLSAVDGALSCRRFKAIRGEPAYAALYHLRDSAVCQSEAWIAAAASPWGARMRRLTFGNRRMVFRRIS